MKIRKSILIIAFIMLFVMTSAINVSADRPVRVEAETGVLTGGANVQGGDRWTESGEYIGMGPTDFTVESSKATFTINAPVAGTYAFEIFYAAREGSYRKMDVIINDGERMSFNLETAEDWDTWMSLSITHELNEGANTIVFASSLDFDGDLVRTPNIDYFTFVLVEPAVLPAIEEAPPVAPAPAVTAPTPAPRTADPITLIAIGAIVSAAGVIIAKKRK